MKIGMNCSPMFASLGTQCLWNEKQVGNQNSLKHIENVGFKSQLYPF